MKRISAVLLLLARSFTFGLFFGTAVFPIGPVLMEAKVGARRAARVGSSTAY
jgi:hypothetical protein